jgi:transaldolase
MFVTVLSCFEPMTVSWETNIESWLTCPRKGTSKMILRTPTCESGFEALNRTAYAGFFVSKFSQGKQGRVTNLKLFIDTANTEEIRKAFDLGVIAGVTTNPSLIAKEGRDFFETVKEIVSIVGNLPISAEVISLESKEMVEQGRKLAALGEGIVIKLPMTEEGLKATKIFTAEGIKTNVTLIFSSPQALLAARAGATYVSPFIGRLDDINQIGINLIKEISTIFKIHNISSEIIAASVRHSSHFIDAATHGSHIATVPYKVIQSMTKHPLTDVGIERFLADWEGAKQNRF